MLLVLQLPLGEQKVAGQTLGQWRRTKVKHFLKGPQSSHSLNWKKNEDDDNNENNDSDGNDDDYDILCGRMIVHK